MMIRISWKPAIMVESSPSSFPVSTISAMPAGAVASTMVGTGYPISHAIAAPNSAIEPAANKHDNTRGPQQAEQPGEELGSELGAERAADHHLGGDEQEIGHSAVDPAEMTRDRPR